MMDAWGAGGFNAPRRKGEEKYGHKGQDFLAKVGDSVIAPMDLRIEHIGRAYPDEHPGEKDPSDLGSIHIYGMGPWYGMMGKLFYAGVLPDVKAGRNFLQGHVIAKAQDRTALATLRDPKRPKMLNHVHFELYIREEGQWRLVDPCAHIKMPQVV